jgi:hypothetical protein
MARIEPRAVAGKGPRAWTLELPPIEATLVRGLPDRLAELLAHPERNQRVIDRLFPPSYADPEEQRVNRRLLGASLLSERREMLDAVRTSLAGAATSRRGALLQLDEAGMDLWLRFVNDVRLVLATELGLDRNLGEVQVRPDDPDAPRYTLLVYLGALESLLVEALIGDPGY